MVGKKIGAYLEDKGIKQAFLVSKTGMSPSLISDICNGNKKKIDCVIYARICNALELPYEYFIDGEED